MATGSSLNLTKMRVPHDGYDGLGRGRWLAYGMTLRPPTVFIDLEAWPPAPVLHENELVTSFDILADGRFVVCSTTTGNKQDCMIRIYPADWLRNPSVEPTSAVPSPINGTLCEVQVVSGRILVYSRMYHQGLPPGTECVLELTDSGLQPVAELPTERAKVPSQISSLPVERANGKVVLGDGKELFIWDGDAYELKNGRFEQIWRLRAVGNGFHHGFTSVPSGEGLYYNSDDKVKVSAAPGKADRLVPGIDCVHSLGPGPEGSIIINHLANDKRLAARIWFPEEGTYLPITLKDLDVPPRWQVPKGIYWSEATRYFTTWNNSDLTMFPESDLKSIKKVNPRAV